MFICRVCGTQSDSAICPMCGALNTEVSSGTQQDRKEKMTRPPAPKNQPALLKDASPVFDPSAPAAPPEEIKKPEPQQQKPAQNVPAGKPDPLHRNAFTRPRRPVVNPQAAQNLYRQEQYTQSQQPTYSQPVYQQPAVQQQPAYQQPVYYQPAQQTPAPQQRYAQQPVRQDPAYQQQKYTQPPVQQPPEYRQPAYQQREMPEPVSEPPKPVIMPEPEEAPIITPDESIYTPLQRPEPVVKNSSANDSTAKKKKKKLRIYVHKKEKNFKEFLNCLKNKLKKYCLIT